VAEENAKSLGNGEDELAVGESEQELLVVFSGMVTFSYVSTDPRIPAARSGALQEGFLQAERRQECRLFLQ